MKSKINRKKVAKSNRYSQKRFNKFMRNNPLSKSAKSAFSIQILKGLSPYL
jgi:hypothetical protein